ncbi:MULTISPECIES: site-specific integrase [Butyricimonas]|uniref:site-specific integrase n=1 Tax=Butyricimonas TaxID=574697 RepID=UPI002A83FD54|nr:site-specific integrase [Butyricimonas paravirosa]
MIGELKVLFFLKKNQTKKNGLCPVMGRISIGRTMAQFSAKLEADTSKWNTKAGRMDGKSHHALDVNRKIDKINLSINRHYRELSQNKGRVSAEEVKNAFQGIASTQETLMKVFAEHNEMFCKRIGIDREETTYKKYCNAYKHLTKFLKKKYNVQDMSFKQLTYGFIEAYDFYLRVELQMKPNTILRNILPLRKMVRFAVNKGYILADPFAPYKPIRGRSEHRFLTMKELKKIMSTNFYSYFRNLTRDMFVFASFTGMAYSDIRELTVKELITTDDGNKWIITARKKTGTVSRIRLLDVAIRIIEKYEKKRTGEKVFPMPKYTTADINLKRIAEICEIEKNVTFHMSRHFFASQVCLSQGVPIETVSRMLGHKDIHTTQIYATVSNDKINSDMKRLSQRIAGKFSFAKQQTTEPTTNQ